MALTQGRQILDYTQQVSVAMPNAANTANTNAIDFGKTNPFPLTEKVQVQISTTVGTGANNKNTNIVLQDSADNSTFANIASLAQIQVVQNTTNTPVSSTIVALPPSVRRYIRASATGEANGGNASDSTLTVALLF